MPNERDAEKSERHEDLQPSEREAAAVESARSAAPARVVALNLRRGALGDGRSGHEPS